MSKKINIGGRIHSIEVGNVAVGANEVLDDTKGKKQNVINSETDAELLRLDQSKQNNLTFDNTPTENSNNPVKSSGVYAADKALSDAIEAILILIPSAATALNQLADKNFVNSSIATDTATFRGTSDTGLSEAQFLEWANSLTHDMNDYVFWQTIDEAGNTLFKRYKWNGTQWLYEYTLNNSSFTADQWAAITSGITTALVEKLVGLPTNAALQQALNGKQDNLTFDNVPTENSNNPVKSGGVYSAVKSEEQARQQLAGVVDGIASDVSDIEDIIPSGATELNQLITNASMVAYIDSIIQNITSSFTIATSDGHINLTLTQVNGQVATLTLTSSDIASAQALTALTGRVTTAEDNITTLGGRVSTNETDIANLQQLYNNLQQSKPVPVTELPETGQQQGVIYRLAGTTSYSDYMWNGSTWVLMATYDNAIDDVPTAGSNNLVKSGGVYPIQLSSDMVNSILGCKLTPVWHSQNILAEGGSWALFSFTFESGKKYIIINLGDVAITPDIYSQSGSGTPTHALYSDHANPNILPGKGIIVTASSNDTQARFYFSYGYNEVMVAPCEDGLIENFYDEQYLNKSLGLISRSNFYIDVTGDSQANRPVSFDVNEGDTYCLVNTGNVDIPCSIFGSNYKRVYVIPNKNIAVGESIVFKSKFTVSGLIMTVNPGTTKFSIYKVSEGFIKYSGLMTGKCDNAFGITDYISFEVTKESASWQDFEYPIKTGTYYMILNVGNVDLTNNIYSASASDPGIYHPLYAKDNPPIKPEDSVIVKSLSDDSLFHIYMNAGTSKFIVFEFSSGMMPSISKLQSEMNQISIDLYGKTWNAVGDSITYNQSYQGYVQEMTSITPISYGVGGCTIAINDSHMQGYSIVERVCGLNGNTAIPDADIWTILGGLNDSLYDTPLGSLAQAGSTFDDTTVYGALQHIVEHILSLKSRQRLILITPTQSIYDNYVAPEHPTTIALIRQAIIDVSEYYALPYIDLWTKSGFNKVNIQRAIDPTTGDGVHWSTLGKKMASPLIAKGIIENFWGKNI